MIELMESEPSDNNKPSYDVFRQDAIETLEITEQNPQDSPTPSGNLKNKPGRRFKVSKLQILLATIAIVLLTGISFAAFKFLTKPPKKAPTAVVINTQSLDNGTLNQLEPKPDGSTQQQLAISTSTIFKNNITVQGSVEIVKNLSVGGTTNIQGGATIKDSLVVGKTVSIGNSLTVSGLITAASLSVGSITISSINVSGDLVFGGHIIPSGGQPSAKASVATAGGRVSVSGNDTAGTIIITTGGGGLTAGEMAIITFRNAFSTTPKVQLTPASAAASDLRYFVTHSGNFFAVNTSAAPAPNATYTFDYLVTQ